MISMLDQDIHDMQREKVGPEFDGLVKRVFADYSSRASLMTRQEMNPSPGTHQVAVFELGGAIVGAMPVLERRGQDGLNAVSARGNLYIVEEGKLRLESRMGVGGNRSSLQAEIGGSSFGDVTDNEVEVGKTPAEGVGVRMVDIIQTEKQNPAEAQAIVDKMKEQLTQPDVLAAIGPVADAQNQMAKSVGISNKVR